MKCGADRGWVCAPDHKVFVKLLDVPVVLVVGESVEVARLIPHERIHQRPVQDPG